MKLRALTLFAILLAANTALAHAGHHHAPGFLDGLAHPVTGWDHLLATLATGLIALGASFKAVKLVEARRTAMMISSALVAGFVLLHGYVHVLQAPEAAASYSIGLGIATLALHAAAAGIGYLVSVRSIEGSAPAR